MSRPSLAEKLAAVLQRSPLSPYRQRNITLLHSLRHPRLLARKALAEVEGRLLGPLLAPRRPDSVAMFHVGRSGSTVLAEITRQHPAVYWDGEIYEKLFQKWERMEGGLDRHARSEVPLSYLGRRMRRSGSRYYGFEVKFFHLRRMGLGLDEYVAGLRALGFTHYIILERRNTLRKIVSSVVGHQKGRFHQPAASQSSLHQVRLNMDELHIDRDTRPLADYLKDYGESFEALKGLLRGERVLHLTYEEDVQADPRLGYRRICAFLGLEPNEVSVPFGKVNPYPLSEMVTNFAEVERSLAGTPYEWMLYE